MKITIPLHSFVDLITNSSTEVYIEVTDQTVTAMKDAVNHILKSQGIEKTADELFNFELSELEERTYGNERSIVITSKTDDPDVTKAAKALTDIIDSVVVEGGNDNC